MRSSILGILLLSSSLTSAACQGNDATSTSGAGGGSGDPPPGGEGAVSVYSYGPPKDALTIAAGFHRYSGARPVCTSEELGACTVRTCENVETPGPAATTGAIAVTVGARTVTIKPTGAGTYAPPIDNTPALFQGGETVGFEVQAFGDVPAHGGSVTAPSPVVLTAPDSTKPVTASRAQDFALAWSGGTIGEVLFVTGVQQPDGSVVALTCRLPADAGQASIPASTLAKLPASGGPTPTFLWVMSRTEIDSGDWHTAFSALAEVLSPNGGPATLSLTIE